MSSVRSAFMADGFDGRAIESALAAHEVGVVGKLERLWSYYRNEAVVQVSGRSSGAQAVGLPARLRGRLRAGDDRAPDREVVIENDIAWRVDALVDFVFGKPLKLVSTASDARVRRVVEQVLDACWESAGGTLLLQELALLGAVHGDVYMLVRAESLQDEAVVEHLVGMFARATDEARERSAARLAGEAVGIELIDAVRGVQVPGPRVGEEVFAVWTSGGDEDRGEVVGSFASRVMGALRKGGATKAGVREGDRVEVLSGDQRVVFANGDRVEGSLHGLDELPVVRIPNRPLRSESSGLSEVEPLLHLQDELNTRLSDRAHRVTMQSFRMYLAKGIDGFHEAPVGPGQVWSTDNPDAEVSSFGGDVYTPSENDHIQQIRDAMDKASGVSPLVLGLLRARIGHLSSENALRVTLMGVLSKAERKRLTYGRGIARVSRLVLRSLSLAGVLPLEEADMGIRIEWPDPLPVDDQRRLQSARLKLDIGVDQTRVLEELGYEPTDAGVI